MDNRVQQRFDRSIREAVAHTRQIKDERARAVIAAKQDKARRLLPAVERALISGQLKGQPLTKDTRDSLRDLRSAYRRVLGYTVDRACKEMPTDLSALGDKC